MSYRRASHVAWRRLGDETVVINLQSKRMYGLNAAAGALWEALPTDDRTAPTRQQNESARARDDAAIRSFLTDLERHGLVDATDGGMTPASLADALASQQSAPQIAWSEEVARSVGSCGYISGQGASCDGSPGTS